MPLRIRINNLNKKRRLKKSSVKKIATKVLRKFHKKDALVDITFISNKKIKVLNKKYMKRNSSTDVISFSLEEKVSSGPKKIIGDIYISSDMAYSNARRFNTDFTKEILLYTVHGMLHALGFGDKTAKEKKRIRKLENKFLNEKTKSR